MAKKYLHLPISCSRFLLFLLFLLLDFVNHGNDTYHNTGNTYQQQDKVKVLLSPRRYCFHILFFCKFLLISCGKNTQKNLNRQEIGEKSDSWDLSTGYSQSHPSSSLFSIYRLMPLSSISSSEAGSHPRKLSSLSS